MSTFIRRVVLAAKLDPEIYEEVEADPAAFVQAAAVVALSGIAMVVGITGRFNSSDLVAGLGLAFLGWAAWSAAAFAIGAWILPEPQTRVNWGELLRTTGFACAPGMLSILGLLPVFTGFIVLVASLWMVIAFEVAVRHALDYKGNVRAVGVCIVGWILCVAGVLALANR
jgi:hypothetical protein